MSAVQCAPTLYFLGSVNERREASGVWRDPPAEGLPDGGGPGLVVVLLVLIHPDLCSTFCVPTSREGKTKLPELGKSGGRLLQFLSVVLGGRTHSLLLARQALHHLAGTAGLFYFD